MARQFDPSDSGYIDVAARIAEFRTKHPEGSLQPADPAKPFEVLTIGQDTYIVVVAAAYRAADDQRPGIGMAYEAYPGRTPYTRGSELQNAETSAWGRAIVAALAADTKRGIASADEVRNRQAERDEAWEAAAPARPATPTRDEVIAKGQAAIAAVGDPAALPALETRVGDLLAAGTITDDDAKSLRALIAGREVELRDQQPVGAGV